MKAKSGNLQFVECGLEDNKKDGVSDAGEFKLSKMQPEFLFLCVKDEKRRKKLMTKRYDKIFDQLKIKVT